MKDELSTLCSKLLVYFVEGGLKKTTFL